MKRLPIVAVFLLVVVAAMSAFAAGVVVGDRDEPGPRMVDAAMMGHDMSGHRMGGHGMGHHADVQDEAGYLAEMIAHHQEAVEAAGELARSERPEMRAFGESIVRTQTAQIEQMTEWLADWYPEQSLDLDYEPMMKDLTGLSGDRLDRVFLEDMVGHHMMAVMMSVQLLSQGTEHGEVAELADAIRDEQHAEILQMRQWLSEWFDDAGAHLHAGMGRQMG